MEPIEWIVIGGIALAALIIDGCSDDSGEEYEDSHVPKDVKPDVYVQDVADVPGEVGEDIVSNDTGGKNDPPGFNTSFLKAGCDIADIDVYNMDMYKKRLFGVCADAIPGENYKRFFYADVDDPSKTYAAIKSPAVADKLHLDALGVPYTYNTIPEQVIWAGQGAFGDNNIVVYSGEGGPNCLSGLSFISNGAYKMVYFQDFPFPASDKMLRPCDMKSAVVVNGSDVWTPFTVNSGNDEMGMLRGCKLLKPDEFSLLGTDDCGKYPTILNGLQPTAITMVPGFNGGGGDFAAVLNSRGYGGKKPVDCDLDKIGSYGCKNASIDIFKLMSPITEGAEKPVAVIDLEVGEVVPLKELPTTADGRYAVAVGENEFLVVDLNLAAVVGKLSDPNIGLNTVKDVAVRGHKAYVATNDNIYIYRLSDPAKPVYLEEIPVSSGGVGSIAVDDNDIIYVTMPDDADPSKGNTRVYSIDPAKVI